MSDAVFANQVRPGLAFDAGPEYLDVTSSFWTDEEKLSGVTIKLYEPTPDDERAAADLAGAARSGDSLAMRVAFATALLSMGEIGERKISSLNRDQAWRALGPKGRALVITAYGEMVAVPEEASVKARASFRRIV